MPTSLGRIAIVDDEIDICRFLRDLLLQHGYEAEYFLSGTQVLATLRQQRFDVILCDLMMPGQDGIDLLSQCMEIDSQIVGIVMTAYGSIDTAVQAIQAGAFEYILKPFDLDKLLSAITRGIRLRQAVSIYELTKTIASTSDLHTLLDKVAESAMQQCQSDEASIMLPTADCRELYVASCRGRLGETIIGQREQIGSGIAGWVAENHKPLILHGAVENPQFGALLKRSGIYSSAVLPMLSAGKVVGVLSVNSLKENHLFTANQLKTLDLLCGAVAPALENARLYKRLQIAESKYRSIFENAVDGIFQSTPHKINEEGATEGGRFLTVNSALASLCGYASPQTMIEEITDLGQQLYKTPADLAALRRLLESQGEVRGFETQWRHRDGSLFWISQSTRIVRDEDGVVLYYEGIIEDISERRQVENSLRESEERFRTFMENTPAKVFIKDERGNYVYFNKAVEQFANVPASELIGETIFDRLPLEVAQRLRDNDEKVLADGKPLQFEEVLPGGDGRLHHDLVVKFPIDGADGKRLLAGVAIDITDHRQAEAELKASEARFKSIVESDLIGIFFWHEDGRITDANNAFLKMMGFNRFDLTSGHLSWKGMTPPEHADADKKARQELIEQGSCNPYEKEFIRKDGSRLPILMGATTFDDTPTGGIAFVLDITKRKKAEENLRHAHSELEDRVQRRTAELAKVNSELQNAKEAADYANQAKSDFLSRMSHELRTPLNAILGFGQILAMNDMDPLSQESVEHILKAGDHLLRLINEVLDIARVEAGRMDFSVEPVDLKAVMQESLDLIRPLAQQNHISIQVEEPQEQPQEQPQVTPIQDLTFLHWSKLDECHVLADRQRLKQSLLNLLANAVKYNRANGKVIISCQHLPQERLRVSIRDTGYGISPDDLDRLFLPFERLEASKTDVEGTGLGLTLSQRMVTAMGGTLGVSSVVNQGSTFYIELPQAKSPLEVSKVEEVNLLSEKAKPETSFTVLSIEDNVSNHRLIEAVLRHRPGARLLGAIQGSIGLELARQHHPDVILLDIHLPDILGNEVLRRLRESSETADIPVIVVSADATPNQIERLMTAGANAYLTKPLKVRELLELLDQIIEDKFK